MIARSRSLSVAPHGPRRRSGPASGGRSRAGRPGASPLPHRACREGRRPSRAWPAQEGAGAMREPRGAPRDRRGRTRRRGRDEEDREAPRTDRGFHGDRGRRGATTKACSTRTPRRSWRSTNRERPGSNEPRRGSSAPGTRRTRGVCMAGSWTKSLSRSRTPPRPVAPARSSPCRERQESTDRRLEKALARSDVWKYSFAKEIASTYPSSPWRPSTASRTRRHHDQP
jgi:hypothetical protein